MERIASRQNPLVRRFRELAHATDPDGAVLVDGTHLLQEALRSHVPVDLVAVAEDASPEAYALAHEAERAGARMLRVSPHVLSGMSPVRHPVGIVAIARCRPATIAQCLQAPRVLALVLLGVQDPGNVGAIVRAAEACGADAVICGLGTADPFGWKALRGGMGSTFRLPIAVNQPVREIVDAARLRRITLLATAASGGTPLRSCDLRQPAAVMLGAEGGGLPPDAMSAASDRITIPMRPPVESLNVAIAAALILFEASRQRELH